MKDKLNKNTWIYKFEYHLNINEQLKKEISNIKAKIKKMKEMKTTNVTEQNENANVIQGYYDREKRKKNIILFGKL